MSARTVKVLAKEQEVLAALADGSKSCREISEWTIRRAQRAWAEEHGLDPDDDDPVALVRILGWSTANERGLSPMHHWQADTVLRRLEQRGQVARVQIEGRRPILWRLPC